METVIPMTELLFWHCAPVCFPVAVDLCGKRTLYLQPDGMLSSRMLGWIKEKQSRNVDLCIIFRPLDKTLAF